MISVPSTGGYYCLPSLIQMKIGRPGDQCERDMDDEPALGLPEASNILRLLTNIVLEGRYTLENGRYLLHLIADVKNLVEMNQLVPGTVE